MAFTLSHGQHHTLVSSALGITVQKFMLKLRQRQLHSKY